MTVEAWLLAATTVIAAVAVFVAGFAIRSVRQLSKQLEDAVVQVGAQGATLETAAARDFEGDFVAAPTTDLRPIELAPRVVAGRVIVPPTQAQVVRTALGRPGVRLSVLIHGLAHALRAENRDRIVALMRREFRHRRRERLRAGRDAIRVAKPSHAPTTERLHAELLEPRPAGLAERMVNP
jgi:hypothetical protein